MYSFTAQLLRTVEGTGLHLCHYRIADFAMYVTVHSYPNDIHVLSVWLLLILTERCIITEVYWIIALNLMRLNLCLILSMFKVAWFLTSSYYWIVNLKQKTYYLFGNFLLVATCMQLMNGRSLTGLVLF